jgi:kynureninase
MVSLTRAACQALDAADPLAKWRERFALPEGVIYLDGNSLGPLPEATAGVLDDVVRRQWGQDLITSWNRHGWVDLPERLGAKIARLIGATAHEVIVADSTSVNLFKLIAAALALRPGRRVARTYLITYEVSTLVGRDPGAAPLATELVASEE